ncbi:DUF2169 domain-containing protein [Xanthobacteraceae bacterium A53D]
MTPEIDNLSPFPHLVFSNTDARGHAFGVLMVKATLDIGADGVCTIAAEQEPFNFTDATHGAVNVSSLRHPSDLVAYKPATDIIVNAVAYAPGGEPARSWTAGLKVADGSGQSVERMVRITGPRQWEARFSAPPTREQKDDPERLRRLFRDWALTEATPISSLPVQYEWAYGGLMPQGADDDGNPILAAHEENPLGRGWIDAAWTDLRTPVPAPQIEDPDAPVTEAGRHTPPAGLGPLPPAWLPRRPLGGTFDQHWKDHVWPRWPADYDFAYNNSAPEGLRHAPHLNGALSVDLVHLRPGGARLRLALPDTGLIAGIVSHDRSVRYFHAALDTVFLDIAAEDLFHCRVQITHRLVFHPGNTRFIAIGMPSAADRAEIEAGSRHVAPPPHPHDVAAPEDALEAAS